MARFFSSTHLRPRQAPWPQAGGYLHTAFVPLVGRQSALARGAVASGMVVASMVSRTPANAAISQVSEVDRAMDAATDYYGRCLWSSDVTGSIRELLAEQGIDEAVAHRFGIGYAPDDGHTLLYELAAAGFGDEVIIAAGIAQRSNRGKLHPYFRSRIMFPLRDADGRTVGFAGRATNPGPSWPLWIMPPEGARFKRSHAVFGIDNARDTIRRERAAVVCDDGLEVIRRHTAGTANAVAVIRSQIAPGHLASIATAMGVEAVGPTEETTDGPTIRAVLVPASGAVSAPSAAAATERRAHEGGIVPDPIVTRSTAVRAGMQVMRALIGMGVPLVWLWIVGFDRGATASATTFVGAVGGVAATYMLLALAAAVVSGRVRSRSRARRMRGPWERGSTEWQPPAWTYHLFEDVMVGAAIVSVFVCTAMFFTIGGFID